MPMRCRLRVDVGNELIEHVDGVVRHLDSEYDVVCPNDHGEFEEGAAYGLTLSEVDDGPDVGVRDKAELEPIRRHTLERTGIAAEDILPLPELRPGVARRQRARDRDLHPLQCTASREIARGRLVIVGDGSNHSSGLDPPAHATLGGIGDSGTRPLHRKMRVSPTCQTIAANESLATPRSR